METVIIDATQSRERLAADGDDYQWIENLNLATKFVRAHLRLRRTDGVITLAAGRKAEYRVGDLELLGRDAEYAGEQLIGELAGFISLQVVG